MEDYERELIQVKIKELKRKAWKDEKEQIELRLVTIGDRELLNPERMVQFGNSGYLDMYNSGRFQTMWDILEWVLELTDPSVKGSGLED